MSLSKPEKKKPSARDIGIGIFAVAALLIAVFVIYQTIQSQQPQIVGTVNLPPGSSPKAQWVKAHKAGKSAGDAQQGGDAGMEDPTAGKIKSAPTGQ